MGRSDFRRPDLVGLRSTSTTGSLWLPDATTNLLDDPPITEYIIQYTHASVPWTTFEDQSTQQTNEATKKKSEIGLTVSYL